MAQPIGFFGLRLTPGEAHQMEVTRDFRITQVAFADEAKDGAKALVKVTYTSFPDSYDDEEDEEDDEKSLPEPEEKTYTLCTLVAGRTDQERVDVHFSEEEIVGFSVTGDVPVDLVGNYIAPPSFYDQEPDSDDEYDSEDMDSDEDDFDMAEMDEDDEEAEDADRFEEIVDSTPAKKEAKKAIEAAAADATASAQKKRAASEIDSPVTTLSKNQQKRLKKAETASAASTPTKKSDAASAAASPATASAKKEKVTETKAEVTKTAKDGKAKTETAAKKTVEKPSGQKLSKTKLPSGLVIEEKKAGEGPQAKAGMKVGMRYVGKLENGKVFDQCVKGKPFSFKLGRGEVIKGWDEGVKGMQVGSERRLTCPPKLAYGNQKIPGIPPNSTLIFDVKLVEMK